MRLYDYIIETRKTWNVENPLAFQICNASLGLSEFNETTAIIGEVLLQYDETYILKDEDKIKIIDELGDLTYYWARLIDLYSELIIDAIDIFIEEEQCPVEISQLDLFVGIDAIFRLQEIAKKYTFHKKSDKYIYDEKKQAIYNSLVEIKFTIQKLCNLSQTTLDEVFAYNVNKLQQRHGSNGFNPNY